MRVSIDGNGSVQMEWTSVHSGAHSRNVTGDMPQVLVDQIIGWAEAREAQLIAENDAYEEERELEREIAKMTERLRAKRGR